MSAVCAIVVAFVLAHTAYDLPSANCPKLVLAPQEEICEILEGNKNCNGVAAYDDGVIYMLQGAMLDKTCYLAHLVHETTHAIQDQVGVLDLMIEATKSDPALKDLPPAIRYSRSPHEREALKVQNKFLASRGWLFIGSYAPTCK